jgi:uracil-DNA glycosylase
MTPAQLRALNPVNWRAALDGNLSEKELEQLARALSDERRVMLPARDQWFRALDETPLSEVRAVILGQDPYPTQGQAEGLAFSVPDGMLPVPPSLRRILSEAAREATIAPGRTSLLQWARRGVLLLLNTALTVPEAKAAGHATIGWQPVTDAILRAVASQSGPVVFMPWGAHARLAVRQADIKDGCPHIVCPAAHPMERRGAFIGSNPFGCANDRLRALGLDPIDWSLD